MAYRAGDQIRSQIAYANLNVKLVGSYCGLSDHADGASHQGVTDLSVMRVLPNMTVVCPADITECMQVVKAAAEYKGPVYIRVSRAECRRLFDSTIHPFKLGKAIELRRGSELTIIATGTMVEAAMKAADQLEDQGIRPNLLEMHTIKPLDREMLLKYAQHTRYWVTCEENTICGGLYGAVAEVLAMSEYSHQIIPIGINDRFGATGSYLELLEEFALTDKHILRVAHSLVNRKIQVRI
jgi:transketolase